MGRRHGHLGDPRKGFCIQRKNEASSVDGPGLAFAEPSN
jgi:hypothetical protein